MIKKHFSLRGSCLRTLGEDGSKKDLVNIDKKRREV